MNKIEYDKSVFRDKMNRKMSIGLFKETSVQPEVIEPVFSLEDWHDVYIECRDPSEYKPAMALVGNWEHWLFIRNNVTLKPIMDLWAEELDALLKSEALESLRVLAAGPSGASAAKWLAEQQYKEKRAIGRPKREKEEVPLSQEEARIMKDAERLFRVK
jgi:hypothetical protein